MVALTGCHKLFGLDPVDDLEGVPPCAPRSVAVGRDATCAVNYRGRVTCWGGNGRNQTIPGGPAVVVMPTELVLPGPAVQVSVGRTFSCARLEDASVWCWGTNNANQLAQGPTYSERGPVQVPMSMIGPSADIQVGGYHACSRSSVDGSVSCWGRNTYLETGQTGAGLDCNPDRTDEDPCMAPAQVPGTANSKVLALGHRSTCTITAEDRVACWGRNTDDQLGFNSPEVDKDRTAVPTVIGVIGTARTVAESGKSGCAVDSDGGVTCWGDADDGQLANGTFDVDETAPIGTLLQNVRDLSIGSYGGCAILENGSISCWGAHDGGTGARAATSQPTPSLIESGASALSSRFHHSCAIVRDEVMCWGPNYDGQLGRGTRSIVTEPIEVSLVAPTSISGGSSHMCANTALGVHCWGTNDRQQAGGGDYIHAYTPEPVATSFTPITTAAAFDQSCALGANGVMQCWGAAGQGRLATGTHARSIGPTNVAAQSVQQIALGNYHSCVLSTTGSVRCFGRNTHGQLGVTSPDDSIGGVIAAASLGAVTQISAGAHHTCAVAGGAAYCWGLNRNGQLGNNTTDSANQPQNVAVLQSKGAVTQLASGAFFNCALVSSLSELYCWGANGRGQLGIGSRTDTSTPARVPLNNVERVWAGGGQSRACARVTGGAVYCWGDGEYGQLGTGTTVDAGTPQLVPAFAGATDIAFSEYGTCALVAGKVMCTGDWRVLANGDQSLSVPTAVDLRLGACDAQ